DAGLDVAREPGRDAAHGARHLLVALAPGALAQGRDLRPCPAAGRAPHRLRPRLPAARRGPDGAGLPHRRAVLLLHARRRLGRDPGARAVEAPRPLSPLPPAPARAAPPAAYAARGCRGGTSGTYA